MPLFLCFQRRAKNASGCLEINIYDGSMKSTSLKIEPWIAWIIHHFITTVLELEMIEQPNVKNLQMDSQHDANVGKFLGKNEEERRHEVF